MTVFTYNPVRIIAGAKNNYLYFKIANAIYTTRDKLYPQPVKYLIKN